MPDKNMFTRFQAIIPLDVVLGHPAMNNGAGVSANIVYCRNRNLNTGREAYIGIFHSTGA
jgi:hypothetical protein